MTRKTFFNTGLLASAVLSSFLFTGCMESKCPSNAGEVKQVGQALADILVKNIKDGGGSRTLLSAEGVEKYGFSNCTIPASTPECKALKGGGVMFVAPSGKSMAAKLKWTGEEAKNFTLVITSKSDTCTFDIYRNGEVAPQYSQARCVSVPGCVEKNSLF